MLTEFTLSFLAPIPVGHRVQLLRVQRWTSPAFGFGGGAPSWQNRDEPVIVDLDTNIVYGDTIVCRALNPSPLAFKPNTGYQVAEVKEGRVTGCIVGSDGGDQTNLRTHLVVEMLPTPGGYR